MLSAERHSSVRTPAGARLCSRPIVALAACGLALFGCGGGDNTLDPQQQAEAMVLDFTSGRIPDAHSAFGHARGFSVITTFLEGDGSRRWAREVAIHNSISKCMLAIGYEYPAIAFTQGDLAREFVQPFIIPLTQPDAVANGYGENIHESPPTADSQPQDTSPGFADAELRCGRQAIEGAFEDYERYSELRKSLEAMRADFATAFWASDPVRELDEAWAKCMEAGGYTYKSTNDARSDGINSEPAEERRIATADAACRAELSYDAQLEKLFEAADANFAIDNSSLILALAEAAAPPEGSEAG